MQPAVSEKLLESYYQLWLKGLTPAQMANKLKLSLKSFNSLTPHFLTYCRHKVKFETREKLAEKGEPVLIELTDERKKEFVELVSSGLTYDKVSLLMNVPLVTVTDYWFKDSIFKSQVEIAVESCNARVVQALYKRSIGYDFEYEEKSSTEGDNKEGGFSSETTTTRKKHVPADVSAQKFFLYNRDKNAWSVDGDKPTASGKGKILDYLENLKDDLTAEDENEFDKEQAEFNEKHNSGI